MKQRLLFTTLLCLLLSRGSASAVLTVGCGDLPRLVQDADIIVSGAMVDVTDVGPAFIGEHAGAGRLVTARIVVRQVLKGATTADRLEVRSAVWSGTIGLEVAPNRDAIVPLKHTSGALTFADPFCPSLPSLAATRVKSSSPFQRVVEAIAAVLHAPEASERTKLEAISVLMDLPSPTPIARSGLRAALQEKNPGVQNAAAAALLRINDISALIVAERALLHPETTSPEDLNNLSVALGEIRSSAALPALTRLMNKGEAITRREVVLALGQIGSKSALRLLRAALDDADFEVRLNAAGAIADALKQDDLRPDPKDFRENEASRKRELKSRLAARGIELP